MSVLAVPRLGPVPVLSMVKTGLSIALGPAPPGVVLPVIGVVVLMDRPLIAVAVMAVRVPYIATVRGSGLSRACRHAQKNAGAEGEGGELLANSLHCTYSRLLHRAVITA